jgi:chromosome condensin MukBEF MukE localization factor
LSLLKINLKSNLSGRNSSETGKGITEEKIHTPTSLFSKLLDYLYEKKLIKDINKDADFDNNIIGQFVHYTGTLERNPIIVFIESFEKIINIYNIFQPNSQNPGKKGSNIKDPNKIIFEQIKSLSESLKSGNIIDIICKLDNTNIETVLQTNVDYFNNRSMNELIDGKFNIVGKVIKATKSTTDDKINLLRNTSPSMINTELLSTLFLQTEEIKNSGIILPELKTEIGGSSMLIIPIAIYV